MNDRPLDLSAFAKRVGIVVLVAGGAVGLALLASRVATTLLVVFGAILLAVFLNGLARLIVYNTGIKRYGLALSLATLVVVLLAVGIGLLLGPRIADQMGELSQRIPQAVQQLEERLSSFEWGRFVLSQTPDPSQMARRGTQGMFGSAAGSLSMLLNVLANVAIALVVGLYLAATPGLYVAGLMHLVPKRHRDRAGDVLEGIGHALRYWLLGRFASMAVVGLLTALGLWLIGVPLALSLGLIAALLSFVPNVGPLLSVIPAIVIALMEAPIYAVYVAALYAGVQTVESYMITPLIQQKAVSIPPALLITFQVIMGVLFGILGLFLATPLVVTIMVVVQMLYVHDMLGDDIHVMGPEEG